jgi:hypothetical protein
LPFAFVGKLLHLIVFVITHAITPVRKEDTTFSFLFNPLLPDSSSLGGTYIKVAVRCQDDPVISIF